MNTRTQNVQGLSQAEKTDCVISVEGQPFYFRLIELADRLRNAGKRKDAIHAANSVSALSGYAADAQKCRIAALFSGGYIHAAAQACNDFLKICRNDAEVIAFRGDCRVALGDWIGASRDYRRALRRNPALVHAQLNYSALLLLAGQISQATRHCELSALKDVRAWTILALCRIHLGQFEQAMDAYAEAFEIEPESVDLMIEIGALWHRVGDYEQAIAWLARALEHDPQDARASERLASIFLGLGHYDRALDLYNTLSNRFPENVDFALGVAHAMWECNLPTDAIRIYDRWIDRLPQDANLRCRKAEVLLSTGQTDAAVASFNEALAISRKSVPAITGLARVLSHQLQRSSVGQARRLLARAHLAENARSALHEGLARYYDGKGKSKFAVIHSSQCNKTYWRFRARSGWRYSSDAHRAHVDRIIDAFSPSLFERLSGAGNTDERPTFIVGMPRSGTTLTERILAAHSQILCLGERPFASQSLRCLALSGSSRNALDRLEQVDAEKITTIARQYGETLNNCAQLHDTDIEKFVRLVDKMPDNYELLGWISLLFPNARIVYVRRDPRDIALSCWMQRFAQIRWACDMNHIADRLYQHYRLMNHWRRTLPIPIHELQYESLVSDTENETRQVLRFLNVPWDDACLDHRSASGVVRTASVSQVCKPIYRSSVHRWKSYEDLLRPVIDRLDIENITNDVSPQSSNRIAKTSYV
jgi:tetratricopeptide (TPR) repeat protein